MPRIGLDTCSFKDKTLAKTERIVQEAEKEKCEIGAGGLCPLRSRQHGMPPPPRAMVTTSRCLECFSRFRNAVFCTCSGPRAFPMLGHFAPLYAIFFDPCGLKNIL